MHFNARLFRGELPSCLITLQRHNRTYGYYSPNKFMSLAGDARTDEIALNPAHFYDRGTCHICSVLVHEMVHLWQQHLGKPPRGNYHDRAWAAAMKAIGLNPSSTGAVGGKETGRHMGHYIIEDGLFAQAYAELSPTIAWGDAVRQESEPKPKAKRWKFICPDCGANVHAVPAMEGKIGCIPCDIIMVPA